MNPNRKSKSISSTSFSKYFILQTPPAELPDNYIHTLLDLWEKGTDIEKDVGKVFFELQARNQLIEFVHKLGRVFLPDISESLAAALIGTIYKNARRLSKEHIGDLGPSEFDASAMLMMRLLNDKISEKDIQLMIEQILSNTPDIFCVVYTAYLSKEEKDGSYHSVYDSIDSKKIMDMASDKLKKHFIDGKTDIFVEFEKAEWAFMLYQWGTTWTTFQPNNKRTVSDYVLSLLANNSRNFVKFVSSFARHHGLKKPIKEWTFDFKRMEEIYDMAGLRSLAERFKDDSSLNPNEREILEAFLSSFPNN